MSATVLRELVAKLGFQVDESGFTRALQGVEQIKQATGAADLRLKALRLDFEVVGQAGQEAAARAGAAGGGLQGLGGNAQKAGGALRVLTGGFKTLQNGLVQLGLGVGIGALMKQVVTLASDAHETDNVLDEVFGQQGGEQVRGWAENMGKYLGRSKYTLRETAGALGAMLQPMTGSSEKAQVMSTKLAELSVDLASFFNTSDSDALQALKSGIAGETEPLRRYGIVLLDATLQEYAHKQGIEKKLAAMSVAEKTELRYRYILANTTKAQGDAHRTADGFANASRALKDNLRDLGTDIGQQLLPVALKLIGWANTAISTFLEVAKHSNIVKSTLAALAIGFAILKAETIASMALPLALFLALALAIDEITTLFQGGQTAIGEWLDELGGIGTTQALVDGLRGAFEGVSQAWSDLKEGFNELPGIIELWDIWSGIVDDTTELLGKLVNVLLKIALPTLAIGDGMRAIGEALGIVKERSKYGKLDVSDRASGRGIDAKTLGVFEQVDARRADRDRNILADRDERRKAAEELRQRKYTADQGLNAAERHLGTIVPLADQRGLSAPVPAAAGGATVNTTTVNQGPVNVNIAPGTNAADAARAARKAAQAERRRTLEAVRRGA